MDRAAMEETFKNMYQIGYEAALKEGAVELNTDKLRAEIGQIKGIGENRLNEIMAVIESNLKSEQQQYSGLVQTNALIRYYTFS